MQRHSYRLPALALAALLLVALAAPRSAAAEPLFVDGAGNGTAAVQDMLVWQVPAARVQTGSVPLRVEILSDGNPVFSDEMVADLRPGDKPSAVEVLARFPADRHFYSVLAQRGNVVLEARVLVDGVEVDRRPLTDLLSAAERAREGELRLSNLHYPAADDADADLASIAARDQDCTARNACFQDCNNDYYTCAEFTCGAPTRLCEECLQILQQCKLQCPPCECVDPKSVTTDVTTELIATTYVYSQCYADPFWPQDDWGIWWDFYQFTYRKTEIETTEYCDGSTSQQVLDVWYEYGSCWSDSFGSCYYPGTYTPYPQCI